MRTMGLYVVAATFLISPPTIADECKDILANGVWAETSTTTNSQTDQSFMNWACRKDASGHPTNLGYSYSDSDYGSSSISLSHDDTSSEQACQYSQGQYKNANFFRNFQQKEGARIIGAWDTCMNGKGEIRTSLRTTFDPKVFYIEANYSDIRVNSPQFNAKVQANPEGQVKCDNAAVTFPGRVQIRCVRNNENTPVDVAIVPDATKINQQPPPVFYDKAFKPAPAATPPPPDPLVGTYYFLGQANKPAKVVRDGNKYLFEDENHRIAAASVVGNTIKIYPWGWVGIANDGYIFWTNNYALWSKKAFDTQAAAKMLVGQWNYVGTPAQISLNAGQLTATGGGGPNSGLTQLTPLNLQGYGTLTGTVTPDGKAIFWGNNTTWIKNE